MSTVNSLDDAIDAIKDYFGQEDVIAEVINHFILEEEKLNPSEMIPVDIMPIFYKLKGYGSKLTLEKFLSMYRNLFLMKTEHFYCVLLVETEMSNALPVKACLFESGLYATQIETWDCLEDGGLLPCITVVLYLSPEPYHLSEIASECPADYCFYMIEPAKISDDKIDKLSEDLGGVLKFAKISNDAMKRQELLSSEEYARMEDSARELIWRFLDYMSIN
ncbi:MAG: hypothetical protein LUG23_00940 [Oscillospiraceae bacterium]|nr:hypothetical protein [Oscillospiraceae bacterium]